MDYRAGLLVGFFNQLRTIYFDSDNNDLPYGPYKQVIAVKLRKSTPIMNYTTLMVSKNRSRSNTKPLRQ